MMYVISYQPWYTFLSSNNEKSDLDMETSVFNSIALMFQKQTIVHFIVCFMFRELISIPKGQLQKQSFPLITFNSYLIVANQAFSLGCLRVSEES